MPPSKPKVKQVIIWQPHAGPQHQFLHAEEFEVMYGGGKGSGKSLSYDSDIITPFGVSKMSDMKVGSLVSNPDGTVATVIGVYPQPKKAMYRVSFTDGAQVLCSGDHLWIARKSARDRKADRRYYPFQEEERVALKIFTTESILKHLDSTKLSSVFIPLTNPVQFTRTCRWDNQFPLDPYILGALLGDGALSRTIPFLSTTDDYIKDRFYSEFKDGQVTSHSGNNYGIHDITDALRSLGLRKTHSHDKFIPNSYKFAPLSVRYELLRGLNDTDGYVDKNGHCSITTVSKQLAEDIQFVARSLGYTAKICCNSAGYRNTNGEWVECRDAYDIWYRGKNKKDLFSLPRKRDRINNDGKEFTFQNKITNIEYVGEEESQCIVVDHPNGLFITNGFVVTHNSDALIIRLIMTPYIHNEKYKGILIRRTYKRLLELKDRCDFIYKKIDPGCVYNKDEHRYYFSTGATVRLSHMEHEEDKWNVWGHEYQIIAIDQVEELSESQYGIIRMCARTTIEGLNPIIRCTANPGVKWVKEYFYDVAPPNEVFTYTVKTPEGKDVSLSRRFIPGTIYDNKTLCERNPEYIGILASEPNERLRRMHLYGEWDVSENAAFSEFSEAVHVKSLNDMFPGKGKPPEGWMVFASMDWGFTRPFSIHWHCITPMDKIYTFREWYGIKWDSVGNKFKRNVGIQMRAADVAHQFVQRSKDLEVQLVVADASMWDKEGHEAGSIGSEMQMILGEAGIPMLKGVRYKGSRNTRKMQTHNRLAIAPDGSPWWSIGSNCVHLIRTLKELSMDENNVEEVSTDGEDHAWDDASLGLAHFPLQLETTSHGLRENIVLMDEYRRNLERMRGNATVPLAYTYR